MRSFSCKLEDHSCQLDIAKQRQSVAVNLADSAASKDFRRDGARCQDYAGMLRETTCLVNNLEELTRAERIEA